MLMLMQNLWPALRFESPIDGNIERKKLKTNAKERIKISHSQLIGGRRI